MDSPAGWFSEMMDLRRWIKWSTPASSGAFAFTKRRMFITRREPTRPSCVCRVSPPMSSTVALRWPRLPRLGIDPNDFELFFTQHSSSLHRLSRST